MAHAGHDGPENRRCLCAGKRGLWPENTSARLASKASRTIKGRHIQLELTILNEGKRIVHTNYWESADAEQGRCMVIRHQETWSLLVPPSSLFNMAQARKACHVRIQRSQSVKGLWGLIFEETDEWRSDAYTYWLSSHRFAPAIRAGQQGILAIWAPAGWVMSFPAHAID